MRFLFWIIPGISILCLIMGLPEQMENHYNTESPYLLYKICHDLRNVDFLWTDLFAAPAVKTGNRPFLFLYCGQSHGSDKIPASTVYGHIMLIIK